MYFDLIDLLALFGVYAGIIFVWGGKNRGQSVKWGTRKGTGKHEGSSNICCCGDSCQKKTKPPNDTFVCFSGPIPTPMFTQCKCFFHFFLTAAPRGVRRRRKEPARYVQRASATMSASGGVSAPALGTAVAGSSRRELLKAVLAATVNIWPHRRCKA